MTDGEVFGVQWNKLKEEMVELFDFQIKNRQGIDFAEANRTYQSKMSRWSSQMQPEGRWLAGVEDEAAVREMKSILSKISLTEETGQTKKGLAAPVGAVAVGAGCVVACRLFDASTLITAGGGLGGLAVTYGVLSGQARRKQMEKCNQMKEAYVSQIVRTGEEIADIWRTHEK